MLCKQTPHGIIIQLEIILFSKLEYFKHIVLIKNLAMMGHFWSVTVTCISINIRILEIYRRLQEILKSFASI